MPVTNAPGLSPPGVDESPTATTPTSVVVDIPVPLAPAPTISAPVADTATLPTSVVVGIPVPVSPAPTIPAPVFVVLPNPVPKPLVTPPVRMPTKPPAPSWNSKDLTPNKAPVWNAKPVVKYYPNAPPRTTMSNGCRKGRKGMMCMCKKMGMMSKNNMMRTKGYLSPASHSIGSYDSVRGVSL